MGSLSIKLLFVFIFGVFLSSSVLAITGAIGNGKMVLNGEVGDILEKSILVINNNNISVNISVYALGDLLDYIDILDEEFVLLPNERKKAYFRVELTQPGTFNPKINIKFTSTNESGGGVGLTSNIIITVVGEGQLDDDQYWWNNDNGSGNQDSGDNSIVLSGAVIKEKFKDINLSFIVVGILGLVWVAILIWLLIVYKKKNRRKLNTKRVGKI